MRPGLRVLVLAVSSLAGCAHAPETRWDARPEAKDELLFSLPRWCGAKGPRRPWTEWAKERDRAPTDRGVCGVRGVDDTDDDGLCVEIEDGVIRRAQLRRPGPTFALAGLAGHEPGAWIAADAGGVPVHVRIEGPAIELATHEGVVRGPCFWR